MFQTLIASKQVADLLGQTDLLIFDCRHDLLNHQAGTLAYQAGHLPGAIFVEFEKLLSGAKHRADGSFSGRHPLPERETFAQTMQDFGLKPQTQVVVYDAQGGMYAARLWWMLRWLGHDKVAVLDGGVQAWQAAGYALCTEVASPSKTDSNLLARPALVNHVDLAMLLDNLSHGSLQVVDARAPDRFRGENESIDPVGGHIPGAINRFFKDNLQSDGYFKPAAQLRAEWQTLIADPGSAVMQCGSGVTACHNLLALEIAGLSGARLYPGSWSEWCSNADRPIARTI